MQVLCSLLSIAIIPTLIIYTEVKVCETYTSLFRHSASDIKGVKKVRSTIKLCSYYFDYSVSDDINVTGIL